MPVRRQHHAADLLDVVVRHLVVEEVAHRIHENLLGRRPPDGVAQFFGHQAQIETELEGMSFHATESLGQGLGVAMLTPWADFSAAPDWVPSGICPLDFRVEAHVSK